MCFGQLAQPAIPELIEALPDPSIQGNVRQALVNIGTPAVPALARVVGQQGAEESKRIGCVETLRLMGPAAKDAMPDLLVALRDPSKWIRGSAARALGAIGPEAKAATAGLVEALPDHEVIAEGGPLFGKTTTSREAAQALMRIDPETGTRVAVPALIRALQSKDTAAQGSALKALGTIGPPAKSAVPALVEVLKEQNQDLRVLAVEALGRIGPDAARWALPAGCYLSRPGVPKRRHQPAGRSRRPTLRSRRVRPRR